MIASGMNLVMTVIGFAVSTLFIVFVCTRLICARIHLNASRRSFPLSSRSDLGLLERGLHGIEPAVVANFPTKKYSEELFSTSENAQCTVCLGEYYKEDMLRILPNCGHSFHVACIDKWLRQHSTCPVCRISLREFPNKKRTMQPLFSSASRSRYGVESLDNHSCNFSLSSQELSPRALEAYPAQESHCAAESDRTECESNRVLKDAVEKRVESPSTT